jgi:hypothetical protein
MPFFDDNGGGTPIDVGTVILTKQNPKIHFKSGYYKAFTATTDLANIASGITHYYAHKHTGDSVNGGGCYTIVNKQPYTVTVKDYKRQNVHHPPDGLHPNAPAGCQCGHCVGWDEEVTVESGSHQETRYKITYSLGCNMTAGAIVRTSNQLDQKSNETLVKSIIKF